MDEEQDDRKGDGSYPWKKQMKPIRQSDGTLLTPFQQAKRYSAELPYSQRPRWIVTCNFQTFHVYDMERPGVDPEVNELSDLEKDYYRLSFLKDTGSESLKKEMEVSIAAGEIVGLLYDASGTSPRPPEQRPGSYASIWFLDQRIHRSGLCC